MTKKKKKRNKSKSIQYNQETKPIEHMIVTYCESQKKYILWINNLQKYLQYAHSENSMEVQIKLWIPEQENKLADVAIVVIVLQDI